MGSIEYINPANQNNFGVKTKHPMPIYIQFVPGIVLDVIVNSESPAYNKPQDINAIVAKPHYGESKSYKILNKKKYYPLFRGMVDVPTIGDQVLLCDFGDVDYYLGPLNTTNNPNFNIDHMNTSDPNIKNTDKYKNKVTNRDIIGLSKSFPLLPVARLQKKFKNKLDHLSDEKRKDIKETHGDIVLEGRHGNSLRIGSRDLYPNIILSNYRLPFMTEESTNDGSIISMTSAGSIYDTLGENFIIGSDAVDGNDKYVGQGNDGEEDRYDYKFGRDKEDNPKMANQIFMNSDKITFSTRNNNITLSAHKNVDIGAGNNLTINTKNLVSIDSTNIYLGKQAKEQNEPLVLGEQLRLILEEMVSILEIFKVTACVAGLSGPPAPDVLQKIIGLKQKLSSAKTAKFQSKKHFIEDN
jgi:hypothetical protein